jgi:hypothetical protein
MEWHGTLWEFSLCFLLGVGGHWVFSGVKFCTFKYLLAEWMDQITEGTVLSQMVPSVSLQMLQIAFRNLHSRFQTLLPCLGTSRSGGLCVDDLLSSCVGSLESECLKSLLLMRGGKFVRLQ